MQAKVLENKTIPTLLSIPQSDHFDLLKLGNKRDYRLIKAISAIAPIDGTLGYSCLDKTIYILLSIP